jgi:hypothetical protein
MWPEKLLASTLAETMLKRSENAIRIRKTILVSRLTILFISFKDQMLFHERQFRVTKMAFRKSRVCKH